MALDSLWAAVGKSEDIEMRADDSQRSFVKIMDEAGMPSPEHESEPSLQFLVHTEKRLSALVFLNSFLPAVGAHGCLLYTSDAADE